MRILYDEDGEYILREVDLDVVESIIKEKHRDLTRRYNANKNSVSTIQDIDMLEEIMYKLHIDY